MATYPRKPRAAFLNWCRVHDNVFSEHAAQLGLSDEEAKAFKTATLIAKNRLLEQRAAQEAALVATQRVKAVFGYLEKTAGNTVRTIRAFAEMSNDPNAVYAIAQIPPPADPSPQRPPVRPSDLSVQLNPTAGTLALRWKATNPVGTSGTSYIIRRRLPGQAEFAFIGVAGKKSFVDDTLVAGTKSAQYTVQGQRADLAGPVSPIFAVHFGKLPSGERTARVTTRTVDAAVVAPRNAQTPAPIGGLQTV